MKIDLGTRVDDGRQVSIDLARLVESRLLLQANSGGGKSFTLRRLLEQSHGHVQHLVLDIEGEFHTLRESFDYVLAARSGGDTLADVRTAGLLARRLLELGVSAVLDLYELKAGDRVKFVRLFLEALVDAPRALWHPALVVVDEAHHFCPQDGAAESAAAVIDLMTRGRKRGFCGVLATQRLAKLHKDAAAEANVKLIGRTGLDVDLRRAADELGFGKAEWPRLRALRAGHFFAFGPGLSDEVIEAHVGSVSTTHPRPGQRAAPTPPARAKVTAVLAKLADLPREAEQEAKTAAELKAENAKLRRELAAKPRPPVPEPPKVERVEVQVLKEGHVKRVEAVAERLRINGEALVEHGRELLAALRAAQVPPRPVQAGKLTAPPQAVRRPAQVAKAHQPAASPTAAAATAGDARISRPQQALLDALAYLESVSFTQPSRGQVALVARVSSKSSGFEKNVSTLRTAGLIAYPAGNLLALTDEGRAIAVAPSKPPTTAELHDAVCERLSGPQQVLLRVLIDAHPDGLTREDLAARAEVSAVSSGFEKNVSTLRSLGLAVYPAQGTVGAAPVLFLEGA